MGNLGLTHITYAPDYTSETHPGGPATFTNDQWIDVFYKRYSFWVLQRVQSLITDPNAGFAILLMLYPYFQMFSRHINGRRGDDFEEFAQGIYSVFESELKGHNPTVCRSVAKWLYAHMRCELAHGNLTGKGVALSDDGTPHIWWDVDNNGLVNAVGVNPRKWFERICDHFENYRNRLLDPTNSKDRTNFLKYTKRQYRKKRS